ncbi:MAG: aspartyl-phosphate phosphatase Spo0E family protein [bacterium]
MCQKYKEHLLSSIEKLRAELISLAAKENNRLNQARVLKKSQELDQLLNKYNT